MTMDASPKTPKRGSRRWSLLSLTPLRSSLKHAPISPVEEAAATPEPAPVAAAAAALPPVVLEDSASEGEDDALDSFVRGLRTSTTCWDSPRPAGPRGPVASLAPESKRVLANVVALVWQRRTLADLHGGCCGGLLAAAERLLPDMDLPGLNFDPPRQQCGDGCIVGCVEELLETAHGVSKRFELACVAALHVVDLDPSRFEMRVKSAERASEKAECDYGAKSPGPACSWVFDALAGRVSVDDEGALLRVLAAVAATPGVAVVGLKNRFRSPTFLGYRDVLALLRFEHGAGSFVCELGLHLRPLLDFDRRHGCRDLYAEFEPLLRGKAPAAAAATVGALRRLGADVLANAMAENELEAIVESVRAGDDAALIGVVADLAELGSDFAASLPLRERLRHLAPGDAALNRAYGVACLEAGDVDVGVDVLKRAAAEIADDDATGGAADTIETYGVALLEKGELEVAIKQLKRAVDLHRAAGRAGTLVEARSLHNVGVALRRKKEPRLAKHALKRALAIREANLCDACDAVNSSRFSLANVLDDLGKRDRAKALYAKIREVHAGLRDGKGDSTSLQRGCSARARSSQSIHAAREARSSKNQPKRVGNGRDRFRTLSLPILRVARRVRGRAAARGRGPLRRGGAGFGGRAGRGFESGGAAPLAPPGQRVVPEDRRGARRARAAGPRRALPPPPGSARLQPRAAGRPELARDAGLGVVRPRAGKESEIPNCKGSYLGRFPLVSAGFWTSDHLSERSRSMDAFPERARAEHSC